ncbi:MAG: isochorismatase family protein [Spirochaetaceae bacterium]|nr:isochorismatase family protein [Spirochaetaceae bacterium]
MKKTALLIIDPQNDFCDPRGSLYINGAQEDCRRLAAFVNSYSDEIHEIYVTLDSHHNYHIAHPLYWIDEKGNHPDPFTIISNEDIQSEKWKTTRPADRDHGAQYVKTLGRKGKYSLCIWPPHCLIGSWGTQIQDNLFEALSSWEKRKVSLVHKIFKGSHPGTEHYGAFEAEVPLKEDKSTELREDIVAKLNEADRVIIAGEALDYCVANSVRQLIGSLGDKDIGKLVLLEDCCSSVDPSPGRSSAFLEEMRDRGMKTIRSTEIVNFK